MTKVIENIDEKIMSLVEKFIEDAIVKVDRFSENVMISIEYSKEKNNVDNVKTIELNKKIREIVDDLKNNLNCRVVYLPSIKNKTNADITSEPQKSNCSSKKQITQSKNKIPNIGKIILVASGKGGVGKSTISANLAIAMSKMGWRVGLLDADIYGASIPTIFSITNYAVELDDKSMMVPKELHGVKINSIEFITKSDEALIWRGPMISKVLQQLIKNTNWGELDYLIIDTPPGTGDIHITLLENYQLDGYVLVSTPHQVSLNNTNKTHQMFKKFNVPNVAFVLNMSGNEDIFSAGNLSTIDCSTSIIEIPFIKNNADSLFALKTEFGKHFVEIARRVLLQGVTINPIGL